MSKEVDGNGNVKIFRFRVYSGEDFDERFTTDYAQGWDWARSYKDNRECYLDDDEVRIDWNYCWLPESQFDEFVNMEYDYERDDIFEALA